MRSKRVMIIREHLISTIFVGLFRFHILFFFFKAHSLFIHRENVTLLSRKLWCHWPALIWASIWERIKSRNYQKPIFFLWQRIHKNKNTKNELPFDQFIDRQPSSTLQKKEPKWIRSRLILWQKFHGPSFPYRIQHVHINEKVRASLNCFCELHAKETPWPTACEKLMQMVKVILYFRLVKSE